MVAISGHWFRVFAQAEKAAGGSAKLGDGPEDSAFSEKGLNWVLTHKYGDNTKAEAQKLLDYMHDHHFLAYTNVPNAGDSKTSFTDIGNLIA